MTDILIIIYLILFSGTAFVLQRAAGYAGNLLQMPFSYTTANQMFREKQIDLVSRRLLDFFFFLCSGIFAVQVISHFKMGKIEQNSLKLLLLVTAGIAGYTILRKSVSFLSSKIFSLEALSDEYNQNIDFHNHLLGLSLLILCPLIQFTKLPELFIYLSGFLIVSNYISLFIRFIKINILAQNSWFHFFLYLCSLEIIPLIYIYKLIAIL